MPVTRPHICEEELAGADIDDDGNVVITVYTAAYAGASRRLTPAEARELAAELTTAIQRAETYAAEQAARS